MMGRNCVGYLEFAHDLRGGSGEGKGNVTGRGEGARAVRMSRESHTVGDDRDR